MGILGVELQPALGARETLPVLLLRLLHPAQAEIHDAELDCRLTLLRIDLGGALEELRRPLEPALAEAEAGVEVVGLVEVGIESESGFQGALRLVVTLGQGVGEQAARDVGFGQLGGQRHRPAAGLVSGREISLRVTEEPVDCRPRR